MPQKNLLNFLYALQYYIRDFCARYLKYLMKY